MAPDDNEFKEINTSNSDVNPEELETVAEPAIETPSIQEDAPKAEESTVTVQPVQFASFEDLDQVAGPQNQNLNILLDVKLQL